MWHIWKNQRRVTGIGNRESAIDNLVGGCKPRQRLLVNRSMGEYVNSEIFEVYLLIED